MNKFIVFYRTLLLAVYALWFGGFTFYTAFVVPTGTEVLGSGRTQGMITQQVTDQLNVIGGFAVAFFVLDLILGWRQRSKAGNIGFTVIVGSILASWVLLVWLHPVLDQMINADEEQISDEPKFYQTHRVYLWVSTIQWGVCWIWLFVTVNGWYDSGRRSLE